MPRFKGKASQHHVAEVRSLNGDTEALVASEKALPLVDDTPPAELTSKGERQAYKDVVRAHRGVGLLRVTDRWAISTFAMKWSAALNLKADFTRHVYDKDSETGRKRVKDGMRMWRMLQADCLAILRELGMTPKSREQFLKDRSETAVNMKQIGYDFHSDPEF